MRSTGESFTRYVLRPIAVYPRQADLKMSCRRRRLKAIWAMGVKRCQGTLWSEEFDGQELHGALVGELRSGAARIRHFPNIVD